MQQVRYNRVASIEAALELGRPAAATFYAGGTTLIDLMKLEVLAPELLIDINHLPLHGIETADGSLSIGALARMSDVADNLAVATHFPAVARALNSSASGQLRNMASIAGNLLQRTRCAYFRDVATSCNKRVPGSGCSALVGLNEEHALLGTSGTCIAVHASDFAVPFVALGGRIRVQNSSGMRTIPASEFFFPPGDTPERETALEHGELVVALELPYSELAKRSTYVKVRERQSYAFALAACAAAITLNGDGTVADVRIALGGVSTIPWRAEAAEAALRGKAPTGDVIETAARSAFAHARPTRQNAYKIELGVSAIVSAVQALIR